ncbi:matrixin family metalloprotease [Blastococcus sp. SYSU D01042]
MREQGSGGEGWLPSSPTGRVPQWVRDEAAGRPPDAPAWRSWSPDGDVVPLGPRRRRRRPGRALASVAVVAALVGAVFLVDGTGLLGGRVTPSVAAGPSPGFEAADEPLGTPPAAPDGGGTHAFVALQPDSDRPVAYDPCRPIHYVVRPDGAPAGSSTLLAEAFARVTEVTGLQFVDDGATDEQPSPERERYQPDRYGDRWAPVLITWETAQENPDLVTAAGMAGSSWLSYPGEPSVYVTGTVVLDADDFVEMLSWPDGWAAARAVVLHELGHLVGLDHVDDPTQLMHPEAGAALDFAAGDLTGLVRLGQGECVPGL